VQQKATGADLVAKTTLAVVWAGPAAALFLSAAAIFSVIAVLAANLGADVAVRLAALTTTIPLWLGIFPGALLAAGQRLVHKRAQADMVRQAGWAFALGTGLVLIGSLPTSSRLLQAFAGVIALCTAAFAARAVQRLRHAQPESALECLFLRLACAWLAVAAIATAAAHCAIAIGLRSSLAWLMSAAHDGAFAAMPVLFLLTQRARIATATGTPGFLPLRLPQLVAIFTVVMVAAAALQAWLWRYPGAQATGAIVVVWVAAIGIVTALLSPQQALLIRPLHPQAAQMWLSTAAPVLAFAYLAVTMIAASLQTRTIAFIEAPPDIWAWGYRVMLAVTCLAAIAAATRDSMPRLRFFFLSHTFLPLTATLAIGLGHWLWLTSSPLAPMPLALAGVAIIALAFFSLPGSHNVLG
jgi:hypothetical protein